MCATKSMQLRIFSKFFTETLGCRGCFHQLVHAQHPHWIRNFTINVTSLKKGVGVPQEKLCVTSEDTNRDTSGFLSSVGLPSKDIKEHNWIINIPTDVLQEKHKLIKQMNFTKVQHTLPFYLLPKNILLNILLCVKADERNNYCKNRLYYLSSRLQCDPAQLSVLLSKRPFIYNNLSFNWIENSLNVLLEMGIPKHRILKDLYVIKYHHETIRKRLESVKATGRTDLSPWMVRCTQAILQRSLQITQETKSILGENSTVATYLANRLNTTVDAINVIFYKIPPLQIMRVLKAKRCLDLLFDEGFTETDILTTPRVLMCSVKTIKYRLDLLRSLGQNSISLILVCKSKKNFSKYYEAAKLKLK